MGIKIFVHRLIKLLFVAYLSIVSPGILKGGDTKVSLYFFYMEGCPHCKGEKIFLDKLKESYAGKLEIVSLEVTKNRKNSKILNQVGRELEVKVPGVPFTVVGRNYIIGWETEETTGLEISNAVEKCLKEGCDDVVQKHLVSISKGSLQADSIPDKIKVPIVGEIKTKNLSLPVLTVILGLLDGFNPCAMWVLLFLISLLLGMPDKTKRWILGISFLLASAFVYFIFMAAWLNLFIFLGYVIWIRIAIGVIALYAGYKYLKEFITNPAGGCTVTEGEKRKKVFERIKEVIQKKNFLLALTGIVLLSFSVNLVEMICSAGLPAIYTHTLAAHHLPALSYYLYLSLYILLFLIDDLIVFVVAMITLQATGITTRYTHISQLLGGVAMLVIGLLLLFKPGWLLFG